MHRHEVVLLQSRRGLKELDVFCRHSGGVNFFEKVVATKYLAFRFAYSALCWECAILEVRADRLVGAYRRSGD